MMKLIGLVVYRLGPPILALGLCVAVMMKIALALVGPGGAAAVVIVFGLLALIDSARRR